MGNVSMIDGHIDEMTDNELIRVLNHIVGLYDKDLTTICGIRLVTLCGDALDLINRQQAEIESLTEKLEAMGDPLEKAQYKMAEQQAENEALKKTIETMTNEQLQFGFEANGG